VSFIAPRRRDHRFCWAPTAQESPPVCACLYGVLTPDGGKACIDGIDIRGETSKGARPTWGVLPHAAGLYNNLTARARNIHYFGALHGMTAQRLTSRTAELSLALGMEGFIDRRAKGFFAGPSASKVALARAPGSRSRQTSCSTSPPTDSM